MPLLIGLLRLIVTVIATVAVLPMARSDVRFERLSSFENGLPGSHVVGLAQDSAGFLWMADLSDGLIRYDGYEFRSYRHDPLDQGSVSSNEVRFVYVDPASTLWVGTGAGLNRYDERSDNFTRITTKSGEPTGLSHDGIACVMVDSAGRLWVGTEQGLNRLDPGAVKFRQYHVKQAYTSGAYGPDFIWTAFEDSKKRLWFGSLGGGLHRYDPSTDSLEQYLYDLTPQSPPLIGVRSIAEDRSGLLWLASENGLSTLNPDTMTFRRIHFSSSVESTNELGLPDIDLQFWSVREDATGHLWLTTRTSGIFRVAPDRRSWVHLRHDPNDAHSLSGDSVWNSFVDRSGQLWFSTAQDGLSRYNPLADAVDHILLPPKVAEQGSMTDLLALPDGRLAVGTAHAGAWIVNPADGKWKRLPWPSTGKAQDVRQMWITPEGAVWVSSRSTLFRIEPTLVKTKSFEELSGALAFHIDRKGAHWFASPGYRGLIRLDLNTGATTEWQHDPKNPESLGHVFVPTMLEDSRDRFWIGTHRGLDLMNRNTGHFKHYDPDPTDPAALPGRDVRLIVEDERADLWIKTNAGVTRYLHESDDFESFRWPESPIDERSLAIGFGNDRLWWSSTTGLTSFDLRERRYRRYGPSHGITRTPTNVEVLPNGTIALALGDRIGLFSPDRLLTDSTQPEVAITGIRLGNRLLGPPRKAEESELRESAWTATRLVLPHDHAPLTFEFAALHFAAPARNRYSFQLEGLDKEWIETNARNRRATYTTLPPGRFVFRVKASNPDGLWNEKGLAFELNILPPWWKTWWAYTIYAVAAVLALLLSVSYRTSSLQARAVMLEKQVAERTRELVEQKGIAETQAKHLEEIVETKDRLMTRISHEFRTPLTVILGPIDRLQSQSESESLRSYLDTAKRNAGRLLRLVDQLLGLARLRSGRVEPTYPVAADPIVRQVAASFESLAADRDLELALESVDDLTLQTTADALEKITVNLVSNAIKYSPRGGRIRISLAGNDDNTGTLTVSDTGRGISPERLPHIFEPFERGHDEAERIPGSGLGLALVHELVAAHGGQVRVESTPVTGSTFWVSLPLASTRAQQSVAAIGVSEEGRVEVAALRAEVAATPTRLAFPVIGATILVIEDNSDMRAYLGQVLGDAYRLAFASDGNQGLQMAVAEIPDLIVCDIMLPGRDGYEVCHAIKTDERTSHIPVILLTALEGRDNRLKGLTEKADDYLTKPFDEAELRQRIANLLDLRAVLQRRFARDLRFDESPPAELSQRDQSFLQKLARVTASHHADPKFDLTRLASAIAIGERHLQRKLHALVGLTPGEYLRAYRLQRAIERLRAGERPGDVAFAVGFSSQAYFSTCFRAQFGFPPSEARERTRHH